ncbi:MAG: hypothetical protein ACREL9_03205 [Gemmatimonadales bacterium]
MLIALVLLVTVLLRFALVCAVVYLLLPKGAACPACGSEMLPLQSRVLAVCLPMVQRRWCLGCGWNGVVRRPSLPPPPPPPPPPSTYRDAISRTARS